VVGRVQNNNYEKDGETVYSMAFTAEEVDYFDTTAEGEALRAQHGPGPESGEKPSAAKPAEKAKAAKRGKGSKAATTHAALDEHSDPIPF
jgi:single-strand DNA-binding protein